MIIIIIILSICILIAITICFYVLMAASCMFLLVPRLTSCFNHGFTET